MKRRPTKKLDDADKYFAKLRKNGTSSQRSSTKTRKYEVKAEELYDRVEEASEINHNMDISMSWEDMHLIPGFYNMFPNLNINPILNIKTMNEKVEELTVKCNEAVGISERTYAKITAGGSESRDPVSFQQVLLSPKADQNKEEHEVTSRNKNLIIYRASEVGDDAKDLIEKEDKLVETLVQATYLSAKTESVIHIGRKSGVARPILVKFAEVIDEEMVFNNL